MNAVSELLRRVENWTCQDVDRGGRRASLESVARRRASELGCPSLDGYVERLAGPDDPEVSRLVEAITVGFTWFFRDAAQWRALTELLRTAWPAGHPLSIWVPGCSTGEDAYTAALLADKAGREARICGTDLSSEAVEIARAGRYGEWSVREMPDEFRGLLRRGPDGLYEVPPSLRGRVEFCRHNLANPPPPAGSGAGWDLVLCRNVLIFFSPRHAAHTLSRLREALAPGGWLLLGASDAPGRLPEGWQPVLLGEHMALRRPAPSALPEVPSRAVVLPERIEPLPGEVGPRAPAPAQASTPSVEELVRRADGQVVSGDLAAAILTCAEALERDPLRREAWLVTGMAFHLMGDPLAALQALRRVQGLGPALWPASFYLALSWERLGDGAAARKEYRRVLECADGPAPVLGCDCSLLAHLEDWKGEAVAFARKRVDAEAVACQASG